MILPTIQASLENLVFSNVSGSDVAAWWGAIVATVTLSWNVFRTVRSKGRLKVETTFQVNSTEPLSPPVFAVRVTNVGSKPILVQGIAIQRKKGSAPSYLFYPCQTPKMLAQGQYFFQVLDRTGWLPTAIKTLYAWDSTGRHWYMARREIRRLVDQHRSLLRGNGTKIDQRHPATMTSVSGRF